MTRIVALLSPGILFFAACTNNGSNGNDAVSSKDSQHTGGRPARSQARSLAAGEDSAFISIDTANKMINSYLHSIQASTNDTNVRSLIVDANALREYLTEGDGNNISHLKIMFAHNLSYINGGKNNLPCGYSVNGLTAILAGYDNSGNYLYFPTERVENQMLPCPHECLSQGTAASDLLVK